MHEVRAERSERASQPQREGGVEVVAAAQTAGRNREGVVEGQRVPVGVVEPDEGDADAAFGKGGQQREQVSLGAADPAHPVDVDDLQGERRRTRATSIERATAAGTASRKSHGTR